MSEIDSTAAVNELLAQVPPEPRVREQLSPGQWVKKNLFNSKLNTVITIVLAPITIYLGYRFFRFVFVTGRWEPVRQNLELFMVARYPRGERWRILTQLVLVAGAAGIGTGLVGKRQRIVAAQTGQPLPPRSWRTYASSYWSIVLYVVVLLAAFTRTFGPLLLTLGCITTGVVGYLIGRALPGAALPYGWTLAALTGVASFQVLSGTGGWAWFFTTVALVPAVGAVVAALPANARLVGAGLGTAAGLVTVILKPGWLGGAAIVLGAFALFTALRGNRVDGARLGLLVAAGGGVYLLGRAIGLDGIDWANWGGLHLSLVVASAAIVLALPLGILLALGRRSKLPAVRVMSVAYIEFFRGAPLISFLLAATFFLGFFLGAGTTLSQITRAIAAITLFSAAYVAEVVRGGLNAVSKGQVEAGQALGLPASKVTRLIVMPQALRAVIPAMVGQFISLFKDTSLLTIIGVAEYLGARDLVHSQNAFRGIGIAETLVFVAFGYWAFTFTMSRESQRLERRLGVGQR
ncbi:MAG TPA: amino acid ABC transporter permease [Ilumatobacter sp.]|nr:amino acid ABC transporter permease [Ilumatobacter sp.]